ncbi:RNA 2',3'-cyclic phosphodiesterase [bacterium]|nr:RNA 2',3'-cyclic phosphodiesterase [bacterium]
MRLFFGVEISRNLGEFIWREIKKSPIYNSPWRWIPARNYHLTLKFLGETDEKLLGDLKEAATRVVSAAGAPFKIRLESFGAFPSLSSPQVVFYSINEGSDKLSGLADGFNREMESLGFKRERWTYHAHLTLARIKKRLSPPLIENLKRIPSLPEEANQQVDSIILFRSHLRHSGATYEKVCDFAL